MTELGHQLLETGYDALRRKRQKLVLMKIPQVVVCQNVWIPLTAVNPAVLLIHLPSITFQTNVAYCGCRTITRIGQNLLRVLSRMDSLHHVGLQRDISSVFKCAHMRTFAFTENGWLCASIVAETDRRAILDCWPLAIETGLFSVLPFFHVFATFHFCKLYLRLLLNSEGSVWSYTIGKKWRLMLLY